MFKRSLTVFIAAVLAHSAYTEPASVSHPMAASVYEHVLTKGVHNAQQAADNLKNSILSAELDEHNRITPEAQQTIDSAFSAFVTAWKSVQAAYIAGELDDNMLDTPQLMDTYHNGKQNLFKQLQRVVASGDEARIALYKNTFKSINALGYYIYADDSTDTTINEAKQRYALATIDALNNHLHDIAQSYSQQREKLLSDEDMSMSYLLNALIESSYKLKEWRVGEAAGLSRKYKNKPDDRRQEYPFSHKSLDAIAAILHTHDKLMGDHTFTNLGSKAIAEGATKEVALIRGLIDTAILQTQQLQTLQPVTFNSLQAKELFATLSKLNDAYYQSLISALPVQAKILDADGD